MLKRLVFFVAIFSLQACATTPAIQYGSLRTSDRFGKELISAGRFQATQVAVIPVEVIIKNPKMGVRWSDDEASVLSGNFSHTSASEKPSLFSYPTQTGSINTSYETISFLCRNILAETFTTNKTRIYADQFELVRYKDVMIANTKLDLTSSAVSCLRNYPRFVALANFNGQQLTSSTEQHKARMADANMSGAGRFGKRLLNTYTDPATWLVGYQGHLDKQAAQAAANALSGESQVMVIDRVEGRILALVHQSMGIGTYDSVPYEWLRAIQSIDTGLNTYKKALESSSHP